MIGTRIAVARWEKWQFPATTTSFAIGIKRVTKGPTITASQTQEIRVRERRRGPYIALPEHKMVILCFVVMFYDFSQQHSGGSCSVEFHWEACRLSHIIAKDFIIEQDELHILTIATEKYTYYIKGSITWSNNHMHHIGKWTNRVKFFNYLEDIVSWVIFLTHITYARPSNLDIRSCWHPWHCLCINSYPYHTRSKLRHQD